MIKIAVENIHCSGCVNSITDMLKKKYQLNHINIDLKNGVIELDDIDGHKRQNISKSLLKLGYPEIDSTQGWQKRKSKAKSLVSCAIGKLK